MGIFSNIRTRRSIQNRARFEEFVITPYLKSFPPTRNPTALAIVNAIASTVMTLGLDLYQYNRNGEKTKEWGHPVARLMNKPNVEDGPSQFLYRMVYNYLFYGNVYIRNVANSALYILESEHVAVDRVNGIKRYTYKPTGEVFTDLSGEIIHIYAPQYYDLTVGHSPIEYNSELFDLISSLYLYMDVYFKNSAGERLVFKVGADAYKDLKTDAVKKEFEKYLQENVRALNAGRAITLKDGITVEAIKQATNSEAELASLIDRLKGDVAALFNYPRFYLTGEYGNNLSDQNEMYARSCIFPITEVFQESLNNLLPPKDRLFMSFEFDFSRLILPNFKELNEIVNSSVRTGVRTKNEARRLLQLPRYVGEQTEVGDTLAWEANLIPALNQYLDKYFANAQKQVEQDKKNAEHDNPVTK